MLDGSATLRTPDGEREVARGDVAHFPVGASGAHQVLNRSDAPVRYLMVAAHTGTDVIEYVDEEKVVVYSNSPSLVHDEGLFFTHDLP